MRIEDTDEYKKCVSAGRDANQIVDETMKSEVYQKYTSEATRLSILKSALLKTQQSEIDGDPFDEELVVFGGSDAYGTQRPINFVALRKDKTFIKITGWDSKLFDCPCKCRVQGTLVSNNYGLSVFPHEDGVSDVSKLSRDECQVILSKVAITVKHLNKLEDMQKYTPYAFRGNIHWVNPTPVFSDGKKIGDNPIVCDNEAVPPKKHVTCGVSIDADGSGFSLTFHLDRQRVGAPIVWVEDFESLAIDSVGMFPDEVRKQGTFLKNGVSGRDIFVVATVGSKKELTPKSGGDPICYINATAVFMMESNPDIKPSEPKSVTDFNPNVTQETLEEPDVIDPADESISPEQQIVSKIVTFGKVNNQDPMYIPGDKLRKVVEIPETYGDAEVQEFKKAASIVYNQK